MKIIITSEAEVPDELGELMVRDIRAFRATLYFQDNRTVLLTLPINCERKED